MKRFVRTVVLSTLMACGGEEKSLPAPREPESDALAYSCYMALADHEGPRAQVFMIGKDDPLWFVSVGAALLHAQVEAEAVAVFYVNDMARATWRRPEPGTWVLAGRAVYVVGSQRGAWAGRGKWCRSPIRQRRHSSPEPTAGG